ncbi:MAG: hypothetical protein AAF570_20880, partial [Bacteroidota bacterium]
MHRTSIYFLLSLCSVFAFSHFSSLQAQGNLLPSIGLNSLPPDSTPICYAPIFTGNYTSSGLQPGDTAFDFTFYDLADNPHHLQSALNQGKPALLIAGSYTCPVFRNKISVINNVVAQYGSALDVFVLYELEAHPDIDTSVYFGYPNPGNANLQAGILYRQPTTYGERKALAQDCVDSLPISATVLIDGPCNEFY